jgi:hypothetical protein
MVRVNKIITGVCIDLKDNHTTNKAGGIIRRFMICSCHLDALDSLVGPLRARGPVIERWLVRNMDWTVTIF